jgi:hypothetical protein
MSQIAWHIDTSVIPTLSAGGGIPRAAPFVTKGCLHRFIWPSTNRAVVRCGAVGGIAQESVIADGASNGRAASGGAWCGPDAAVVATVIGRHCGFGAAVIERESGGPDAAAAGATAIGGRCAVGTVVTASSEGVDSCCDGGGVFSFESH